jgi:NRAMP (natural resistance-associated macrophage protein)-like metal ion transporter
MRGRPRLRPRNPLAVKLLALVAFLGPGIVAANAGNDAGGIATYASVGAKYGYDLLWMMALITISLVVVQEACARMGIVTGKGLAGLIRERFGVRWTALAITSFFVASVATTASEFAGIAASSELFGVSRYVSVPVALAVVFYLVAGGTYRIVERVFLAMTVVFFGYVATAFMTTQHWLPVLRASVVPTLRLDPGFLFMAITLIGTTITSYMQFFLQAAYVERGTGVRELKLARADVVISSIFANLIAFCIIVTTAQTLHRTGVTIDTAAEAARALVPLAGRYAEILFAVGLVGASLFGATVLPLSTAYLTTEAFGFERGIAHTFREAPAFMGIYTVTLLLGALIALVPDMPLVRLMVVSQFIDGVQLPIILVFIVLLVRDPTVMGAYASGRTLQIVQWATAIVLGIMSLLLLGLTA